MQIYQRTAIFTMHFHINTTTAKTEPCLESTKVKVVFESFAFIAGNWSRYWTMHISKSFLCMNEWKMHASSFWPNNEYIRLWSVCCRFHPVYPFCVLSSNESLWICSFVCVFGVNCTKSRLLWNFSVQLHWVRSRAMTHTGEIGITMHTFYYCQVISKEQGN